jgi:hypothetical protein
MYPGCRVNQLQWSMERSGLVTATVGVIAQGEDKSATSQAGTVQVTERGLLALSGHEGVVPAPYRDSTGAWTFGIGHTAAARPPDPAAMPLQQSALLVIDHRRARDTYALRQFRDLMHPPPCQPIPLLDRRDRRRV